MTMTFYYFSPTTPTSTTFTVDLGTDAVRLGNMGGLIDAAEVGATGMCNIEIDDPLGDVGHNSDAILGLKQFFVVEDACPPGDQRLWTGYILDRRYRRGQDSLRLGAARKIDVTLLDVNTLMTFRILTDPDVVRPPETVDERMAWFLAADPMSAVIFDNGFVDSSAVDMDACDYTGQTPGDVLGDMALAAGFNYFLYYDETANQDSLWFADSNTSTWYVSALSLSNDLADLDIAAVNAGTATIWPMAPDAELVRDPSRVYAGVFLPYSGGTVYRTETDVGLTTSDIYGFRDGAAPTANVKSAPTAEALADRLLLESASDAEDDRITCRVQLPASLATAIKAGQRLQVKATHLPGYEDFRWCRVLRRTVAQDNPTDAYYTVTLELSPQAPAIGGILVAYVVGRGGTVAEPTITGWTKGYWSGDFASAIQFPGPGVLQGCGIWYRNVIAGEDANVLTLTNPGGTNTYGVWVHELSGITLSGLSVVSGTDALNPAVNATATVGATAGAASVLFGGQSLQQVDYGSMAKITVSGGTKVFAGGLDNTSGEDGAYHGATANQFPPWSWIGYDEGTGALSMGGTLIWTGAGPDYDVMGRGWAALLLPRPGTFSIVQSAHNKSGVAGASFDVTLSAPPT